MKEKDKRAVEGMVRCGISLEGLIDAFPSFPKEEVMAIYEGIHNSEISMNTVTIKMNCS